MKEQSQQIESTLSQQADADSDWIQGHARKLDAQKEVAGLEEIKEKSKKVNERLERANNSVKARQQSNRHSSYKAGDNKLGKRKAEKNEDVLGIGEEYEQSLEGEAKENDTDLLPNQLKATAEQELLEQSRLQCTKIIYASRTHTQLEQFALEIQKTRFRPRIITLGSRQALCINEQVRALKVSGLVNERCNELLSTKKSTSDKRTKEEDGGMTKTPKANSNCGCGFAKTDAIEDLADEILSSVTDLKGTTRRLTEIGHELNACPYFATRKSLSLCELVLVPYNILLHSSTRDAWNLDIKDNVVIIDEAHNLLQTLAGIHAVEVDERLLQRVCSILHDYIDRFRSRLAARNLLHIRQLQTFAVALYKFLRTASNAAQHDLNMSGISSQLLDNTDDVFTLPGFISRLDCADVDVFKLLEYLDQSKLCRKLRDFTCRYSMSNVSANQSNTFNSPKATNSSNVVNSPTASPKVSGFSSPKVSQLMEQFKKAQSPLAKTPRGMSRSPSGIGATPKRTPTGRRMEMRTPQGFKAQTEVEEKAKVTQTSAPLYQLKEFMEALTSKAEDARIIVIPKSEASDCAKLRFLLLNPADRLREIANDCRSLILVGGTMRPVDQLMDAFERVCNLPGDRICQFACGHVIDDSQLTALSLARGPNRMELNLNFSSRTNQEMLVSISQTFVNLLRHVPNGVVGFFPSYGFLSQFVNAIRTSGHLSQIENVKPVFIESRDGGDDVWTNFCVACRNQKGAFLLAVVGGKLSEGINFSDELGRCVFMVGLPYANKNSVELRERMKYVEEKIGVGAGNRLYETLCMQAVNQAIGRVIRHSKDFAAIILLDVRYAKPEISVSLPGWIQDRLSHCQEFPQALTKLMTFFREKS
ncbi:DEAD2 domain-containing protein [Ditylenchus destructor]|uniref:DEAD2 domain-containing protein n=1 Tax=Ditylenchus destructor TaxID=166010 RepID=A0AAD4RCZ9_9BILA|nr:DEAD2 domain-containing protein [Ditylenchus destructor]